MEGLVCVWVVDIGVVMHLFFFNDTATTEIYTLSLPDALPILGDRPGLRDFRVSATRRSVNAAVDLRLAGRTDEIVDFPRVNPVHAGQHFVVGEGIAASGDCHLRDDRHFRQKTLLRRQGDFHAEIQVFGARRQIGRAHV